MKLPACIRTGALILLLAVPASHGGAPDITRTYDSVWPRSDWKILGDQRGVELGGRIKAETAVFRRTRWELKSMPQGVRQGMEMSRDAMQLPEAERLTLMNCIRDHCQVWAVDLGKHLDAGAEVKSLLKPLELPHESFREIAYLGHDGSNAWYAYMPIYAWVSAQKKLGLKEGDDPLAAAIRGLNVEDRGSMTANSVPGILVEAGLPSLPYLRTAIAGTNFSPSIRVLNSMKEPAAGAYLVELAKDSRADVAKVARHYLETSYRDAALPLYRKWLEQDAGRGEVYRLLSILSGNHPEEVQPYLARIMNSPATFREYRLAFEVSRKIEKSGIPPKLLQIERDIRKYGYRSGENYDQSKVDGLADELAHSDDPVAAAVIAADLMVSVTKGNWRPANKAGMDVLNRLPEGQGIRLLNHLQIHCRDADFSQRVASVLK